MNKGLVIAVAWAASATVLTGLAVAQEPAVVKEPDWLRKPSAEDLYSVWPARGRKGGKAAIDCVVTVQGTLRDCKVARESPAGDGFGEAALALAPQFVMKPQTVNGKPTESRVTIPINFECPERADSLIAGCADLIGAGRKLLTGIYWTYAPSVADIVAAYPAKARQGGLAGVASLSCVINNEQGLRGCRIMSEEPKGQGFGRAALDLSQHFREPLNVQSGTPLTGLAAQVTFTFDPRALNGAPAIGKPRWTSAPTMAEAVAVFPEAARAENIFEGRSIVRCTVAQGGGLTDCQTASETPAGKGFGEAALKLTEKLKLATWTDEGLPVVGGSIRVPISFKLDGPTAPPGAAP